MTDVNSASVSHLTPATIDEYFGNAVPTAFYLSETLPARLEIDPINERIHLFCPAFGSGPDLASYERILVSRHLLAGHQGEWFELNVDAQGMRHEAYALAESVVVQMLEGASFHHAVLKAIDSIRNLLLKRDRLSDEKETGLLGELLVLEHVISTSSEDSAITAWLGPDSEEHDFAFDAFEAEVKTTRSERRAHIIGSDSQLLASPGRDLYLISLQLTQAAAAPSGFTLPEVVARLRAKLDQGTQAFDEKIRSLGWDDEQADLYTTRFQYRSQPRAYFVDSHFPAITGTLLDRFVPQYSLVSDVTYRVDVSHLPCTAPPAPLTEFCEGPA